MDETFDALPLLKVLADETRLKILRLLAKREMCACRLLEEFRFTQPTLSYHMKLLMGSGLVHGTRDGAWMIYSLDRERFGKMLACLAGLCDADAPIPSALAPVAATAGWRQPSGN